MSVLALGIFEQYVLQFAAQRTLQTCVLDLLHSSVFSKHIDRVVAMFQMPWAEPAK